MRILRPSIAPACGVAFCLSLFGVIAAEPQYELTKPIVLNVGGENIQVPAGQTVTIFRGMNANGDVVVRFVLPNGTLRMAQVPATNVRQKVAGATPVPTPVVAAPVPVATPAVVAAAPALAETSTPAQPPAPETAAAPEAAPATAATPAAVVATPALAVAAPAVSSAAGPANFGPNVLIFDPSMTDIQQRVDTIASQQQPSQFGGGRYALLFKPGKYTLNLRVGYYTHVVGLGATVDSVSIKGAVDSTDKGNVTTTFWRAVENLAVEPTAKNGNCYWAVSQGTAMRRFHVKGNLWLFSGQGGKEWASGGFLADCLIDGKVVPGSQQQWFSRNASWGSWAGGVWNMVFVGVPGAPKSWPPDTSVDASPVIAEKPYLYIDNTGNYSVMVPSVRNDSKGSNKPDAIPAGTSIPISQFYIAHAGGDTAATINAALKLGKNLIFTPGIYNLETSVEIARPGTVVLGLGYPTLIPMGGTPAIKVADVNGVRLGALLLEASPVNSPTLLQIGEPGSTASHAADPIFIYDIFARVGGPGPGSTDCMVTINSSNVVGDNAWLWRADHGAGVGWNINKNKNGIIVNGNNVIYYGLAVEHTQEYQTVWNGNGGRLYFYQSELPYDVPSQSVWQHGATKGWASYKVGDSVRSHEAWGVGIYSYFTGGDVVSDNAIETPNTSGVQIHHMVNVHLGGKGGISHFVNGVGPAVMGKNGGFQASNFAEWPSR